MRAVLFDLDGTLLDTLQDIADACNAALAKHGFPGHPVNAYRYFIGDGVPALISRVAPAAQHDPRLLAELVAAYKNEYKIRWNATTRPYDGIPELLDELLACNCKLAVLSNKPHESTVHCVAEFLPKWKFDFVQGATSTFPPKPDPASALHVASQLNVDPAKVLYLGDTATDMKTALGAGMMPIGALWGFRAADELQASGARHLIDHPLALAKLL